MIHTEASTAAMGSRTGGEATRSFDASDDPLSQQARWRIGVPA